MDESYILRDLCTSFLSITYVVRVVVGIKTLSGNGYSFHIYTIKTQKYREY